MRQENGVETAIQAVYRDLEYARTLIKKPHGAGDMPDDSEESWTMIEGESVVSEVKKAVLEAKKSEVRLATSPPPEKKAPVQFNAMIN